MHTKDLEKILSVTSSNFTFGVQKPQGLSVSFIRSSSKISAQLYYAISALSVAFNIQPRLFKLFSHFILLRILLFLGLGRNVTQRFY